METNIILHSTPKSELKNLIAETLKEQLSTFFEKYKEPDTRLKTRKEVAEMLNITLPTLHIWTKEGVIPAVRIGASIRYRMSDIENAIKNIRSIKYSRYNR